MIILLQIGTQDFGESFRIARRVAAQGKKIIILFTGEGCRLAEDPQIVDQPKLRPPPRSQGRL